MTAAQDLAPIGHIFARGDHVELGAALVVKLGGRAEIVFDELHPWRYESERGVWTKIEPSLESRIVQGFAGFPKAAGDTRIRIKAADVSGAIKLAHDQVARTGYFAEASGVAFADCYVRATTTGLEVRPHARENRARAGYVFEYAKGALPRRWLAFLGDLFRDDDDRDEKQSLLQEFCGACVLGIATRYQRSIIAAGTGENGKSALADVQLACMPPGTTSAIPPQDWGQEYRRAMLVGKHLNAVGELPEREILASEAFKAIVAGDPIVGRIIRESPLMFRPIAGHYFAANKLPGTSDQTHGFWRRFVVLTFNRSFENDPTRDPEIVSKVLEERPAIVAWMLAGAERLIRERAYTIPSSHHKALAEWRKNADQVALFVESEVRPLAVAEPDACGTAGATLYGMYKHWCEANGHRALASNRFAERMQGLGLGAKRTSRGALYPVTRVTGSDGSVTGHPSQLSREAAHA